MKSSIYGFGLVCFIMASSNIVFANETYEAKQLYNSASLHFNYKCNTVYSAEAMQKRLSEEPEQSRKSISLRADYEKKVMCDCMVSELTILSNTSNGRITQDAAKTRVQQSVYKCNAKYLRPLMNDMCVTGLENKASPDKVTQACACVNNIMNKMDDNTIVQIGLDVDKYFSSNTVSKNMDDMPMAEIVYSLKNCVTDAGIRQ